MFTIAHTKYETRHNPLFPAEIRRSEHFGRPSILHPSSFPSPPVPVLTVSGAADAKAIFCQHRKPSMKAQSTCNNSLTLTKPNTNSNPMKTTKPSRSRKPVQVLVAFIAACAVLGLASSASAANWSNATNVNLLWNDGTNWSPTGVPTSGINRVERSIAQGDAGTITMNYDYSSGPVMSEIQFFGGEKVSIESTLKTSGGASGVKLNNGGTGGRGALIFVPATPATGTIVGNIDLASEQGRIAPILEFTGGNWTSGNVVGTDGGRQGGVIKVSSTTGTLTPGAIVLTSAPVASVVNFPGFSFVLTGAGATAVAPITFTAANPLDFTGAAAGTSRYTLTVDASAYSGTTVDVPLIVLNNADTDRMFSAGNITIANVPVGKGAFVTQSNTGTTLTLVDAGDWSGGASPDTQWATAGNWTGGNVPGSTLARAIANFPTAAVNDKFTVTLDGTSPTLAVLNINSGTLAAKSYSIGQGTSGTINLGATPTGSAFAAAQINVLKGTSNTISAPVTLLMNGEVSTAASTSLTMSGAISGSGFSLTKSGTGTLVLSGGANSYTGATIIEAGILSVSNLANAGVNSDLGAYPTAGAAGIVIKGGTLKYTGSTMGAAIDRGITLTASSTVDLPIAGDMRLGSLALASAAAYDLNVTGSGAGTSRLYIDSVIVPTSTVNRQGPVFKPGTTASLTIGSITGNGNFQMVGAAGSSDNIITGPINLGAGNTTTEQEQIFGPIANNTWTIMSENTFPGRWYAAAGVVKIKSPGNGGSPNVSTAFGNGNWPGTAQGTTKFYNGNTVVHLLNDVSTSYENGSGQRTSVRAGGSTATFLVDRQGTTATNQTHSLGNLWIHDGNCDVIVNGNNGFGLSFDTVTARDGQTDQKITANTTLTLASVTKSASGTNALKFRGSGTTTVTGAVSQPGGTFNITKEGNGTLILKGTNTYTGTTTVSQGTLALVGGSQSSPITVSNGAFLAFDVASPTTSTNTYNLNAGSKIKIIGTPTESSYTLTTSSGITGITGNTNLDVLIPGYDLVVEGTSLILKKPSGYVTWAAINGAGANLDEDHDGDSVPNGIEYFFGGPNGNTTGLTPLPGVVNNAGTLSVTWIKAADYVGVYGTDFVVETSATVAAPWIPAILAPAAGSTVTITGNEVKFTFPDGPPYDGKNFVRLKVTGP